MVRRGFGDFREGISCVMAVLVKISGEIRRTRIDGWVVFVCSSDQRCRVRMYSSMYSPVAVFVCYKDILHSDKDKYMAVQ